MKRYVEFPLSGGGSIVVEVEEPGLETGVERAGRRGEISEQAEQTLEAAIDRIRPAAVAVISKLRDLAEPPDQIGVEFGVKLSGKYGAIIASAETEANFKVTLSWKQQPPPPMAR